MAHSIELFEVGGAVRDGLLGIECKDIDFVAVVSSAEQLPFDKAFAILTEDLTDQGFNVFQSKEEFGTIRARVPKGHELLNRTTVADFVLARKDGPSSDGRRPDFVLSGTLLDDLSRRDFTINAMAQGLNGGLIDPHCGLADLLNGVLRFVGDPIKRIEEDGLRVLRAWRFCVTKGLKAESATSAALMSDTALRMLKTVSVERMREELEKMFKFDSIRTLGLLSNLGPTMNSAIFRDGLRLSATLKS